MKALIKYIILGISLSLLACDKNNDPDLETKLSDFGFITQDFSIVLQGTNDASVKLEWESSYAENQTLVFYRVQFSDDKDDFSDPTYELIPERLGSNAFVSITDSVLNIIAEKTSVKQLSTGKMYWRVLASNGINQTLITGGSREIEVTRPEGFAAYPDKLYLIGSATQGGDDLSQAIPLKVTKKKSDTSADSVEYNIIVPLKQGNLKLVSALKGRVRSFVVNANGNLEEVFEDEQMQCTAEGMFHIGGNFITRDAAYAQINNVELVVIKTGTPDDVITTLNYEGDYTWTSDYTSNASGGGNLASGAQYKFRITETGVLNALPQTVYWGSTAPTATPPTATTDESYFYVTKVDNDMRNYYRFPTAASGLTNSGKSMRVVLKMNSAAENYSHTNTIME